MDTPLAVSLINDSLKNFVSKLGTLSGKDAHSFFSSSVVSPQELMACYRFGGIGGKIVDAVADDMGRKWRKVSASGYDFASFYDLENRLKVKNAFVNAERWAGLFGGAVIVIDIDGDEPSLPLELDSVIPAKPVTAFRVLTRHEFTTGSTDPKTGYKLDYTEQRTLLRYHPSRVLVFDGIPLPTKDRADNQGWGGSRLERCYASLVAEATVGGTMKELLHEAYTDVVGVSNLDMYMDGGENQQRFLERYALAKMMKSAVNVTLYDKDNEEWGERGTAQALASIAPIMERLANRVAGESDLPMTRLYGSLASGLNTSAGINQKDYYDMLAARQESNWSDRLEIVDELLFLSLGVPMPEDYYSEWLPLAELTEDEQAKVDKTKAETSHIYITDGVAVPAQVAEQVATSGPYDYPEEMLQYMRERDGLETPPDATPDPVDVTQTAPGVPGAAGAPVERDVQKEALNGTQTASLVNIATSVKNGEIDREQAIAIIMISFPTVSVEEAGRVAGEYDPSTKPEPVPQTLQRTAPPDPDDVRPNEI